MVGIQSRGDRRRGRMSDGGQHDPASRFYAAVFDLVSRFKVVLRGSKIIKDPSPPSDYVDVIPRIWPANVSLGSPWGPERGEGIPKLRHPVREMKEVVRIVLRSVGHSSQNRQSD